MAVPDPVDETWTLVGIVSVGKVINKSKPDETCNLSEYVLYTDVAKFHSWINRVIMETDRDTMPDTAAYNFIEISHSEKICYSLSLIFLLTLTQILHWRQLYL